MKKNIQVKWMHCISCEIVLERELKKISWLEIIMINHKKWLIELNYKKESDYKKIVDIIEKNWFSVIEKTNLTKNNQNNLDSTKNLLWNMIAIMLVVILFMMSKLFDLYHLVPDTSTVNYISAILIWLIASVSTCLAITWWIIVWFSKFLDKSHGFLWHLKVQTSFQVWRILWFFIFWWILWYLGNFIQFNFTFTSVLNLFIWFILFYVWLNILGLTPSITKFWVHMPKRFVSKIEKLWQPKFAPIVWALTFFLPCWFTQTMQLLAVSTWSFMAWWFVMMLFAIWTMPVFMALWLGSSYFSEKKFTILNKLVWAIVIFFWVFTLYNSYNLVRYIDLNPFTSKVQDISWASSWEEFTWEVETINITHNWWQTIPSIINLEVWKNYKLVVTPTSNWVWCMSTQVIPGISNRVTPVVEWQDIIYNIYNAKPGKFNIVCASMWMTQWQIIIK